MKYYTRRHKHTCGVDLHPGSMYPYVLNDQGDMVSHKRLACDKAAFLEFIAPYRDDLVVVTESTFCWYWLSDLCAENDIHFVLGHALYMKGVHGSKHKNDKLDAETIARSAYNKSIPPTYAYPKGRRSTRDLLRRRMLLVNSRSKLLSHITNTASQYNLPRFPKRLSYKSNREGVPAHFSSLDASARKIIDVDLRLAEVFDEQIKGIEHVVLQQAKSQDGNALMLLQTIPDVGKVLGLTLLYEIDDIHRFKSVGDFVSYCRLVPGQRSSDGKKVKSHKGQKKIGNSYLRWAFGEIAVLMKRDVPEAKKITAKHERRSGSALKANSVLSAKICRVVYHMLQSGTAFDAQRFFK